MSWLQKPTISFGVRGASPSLRACTTAVSRSSRGFWVRSAISSSKNVQNSIWVSSVASSASSVIAVPMAALIASAQRAKSPELSTGTPSSVASACTGAGEQ